MAPEIDFFPADGEVAAMIRAKDWSRTSLGAPATWPASLRTVLRLMLSSRYAMWMGWGPELIFFHNDAYAAQTLGDKKAWALGTPTSIVWAEIWKDAIGPRVENVLRTGKASWDEGLLLFLERSGYREETYHTFSYSPAPGEGGETGGLFCVVIEETERVIDGRRMALLRELGSLLGQTMTAAEVFAIVERCLGNHQRDITFSLTYLFDDDGKSARRVSQTGFDAAHGAPAQILGTAELGPWPLEAALAGGGPVVVTLAPERSWPKGAWDVPPAKALVVPIPHAGRSRPSGVFIVGVNPHRPLDEGYRSFVELFVGQVAASLSNAGAYAEAKERADALAEIDRAKTAFFSNVSHEFRTPLTLMLGPTQDALAMPGGALAGPELEMVYRNELRLLKLVNALLDFARIEAGRTQAAYEPTDLAEFTADLASSFRSAIDRAGLRFDVECAPLPEPIFVDHEMWEKIVLNLLSNALKFTFDGSIAVKVAWRGDHAELTVKDSGVGIAAHELPRLFERFRRIEGVRARTHEGSGIGLALVHDLVRLHGGTIDVASEVDRGTTFTISIPAGSSHLPAAALAAPRSHPQRSPGAAYVEEALRWIQTTPGGDATEAKGAASGGLVLVVDDNADMREYIARILRPHWTIETAPDGRAALEAIRARHPDLVISDVMMPHLDGFGLIRELRADPATATTPVILLSARAGEEATAEGLRAGANDYLVKPFSASAILVRVEAQLSAARLRDAIRRSADEERERLRTMFHVSPAAIAILRGPALTVELANPLMLEYWGKTSAILGMPLLDGVPELRGQGLDVMLEEVLATGIVRQGKERLVRLDRDRTGQLREYYLDFVYAPQPGPDGAPAGIFVHAYDVTDKVRARGHIDQLRQDAEAANRLKDEFLATMSHELRTPLNAILGWASLLRGGDMEKNAVDRALATIERNAKSQARLIEDVLDVSRIISGKLRLDVRRVDVNAIARAAVDVLRPAADAKGVRLVIELGAPEGLELSGDPDRLQQVVWNLLSNAVKFTPPGGTVWVRIVPRDGAVQIAVRDTGPGILPEHLQFIFERFRQVDSTTTRKHGGLGLGLAIVRHLVELHGGSVTAESDGQGAGATFTVTLPTRNARAADEVPFAPDAGATASAVEPWASLDGVRVLVVDDEADARALVSSALERAGAVVKAVDAAAAAFTFLKGNRVDVLVSDVGMPHEDGFSLIQRIRTLPPDLGGNVRAIALTAYARADDAAKALRFGFQIHLAKPTDLHELARAVALLASGGTPVG